MRRVLIVLMILCLIPLTGCWDSREINELGLVMAVGIDKDPDSGDFIVTAQIANQKGFAMQGGGTGSESEKIYVSSAEGKSLFDAVRELSRSSSKRIMWAHNYIVIIGEDVARDSILPVVDFFTHNPELRLKTAVVVSEGDAKDYIAIKSGTEDIPGASYSEIYRYDWLTGEYIQTDMLDLCHSVHTEYRQPFLSKISFLNNRLMPGEDVPAKQVEQVEFGGSAVFYNDRMAGWLTPEETRGLSWVMQKAESAIIPVEEPSYPGKYVSVEMHSISTNITADLDNGQPSIMIEIDGMGHITEEGAAKSMSMNDFKKAVAGSAARQIVNDISACFYKIQKVYKSDVLGLADVVHSQHNEEWENGIRQRWKEIYPDVPVTINVKVTITNSALFQTPLQTPQKD